MTLSEAVEMMLKAHQEKRLAIESRIDSYGTSIDEAVKELNLLVKHLAEKERVGVQS